MQRISVLLFLSFSTVGVAQKVTTIYVDQAKHSTRTFSDSLDATAYVRELQLDWVNQGHYFAGMDSIVRGMEGTSFFLHKGKKYQSSIEVGKQQKLQKQLSRQLELYLNNGYPFAMVYLDSLSMNGTHLKGKMVVEEGPEIRYDSASFLSNIKTNKSYVYQLLDIKPNTLFGEQNYRTMGRKIERSSFLEFREEPDISFQKNEATIYLNLSESSSNTFRGVLGLQQAPDGGASAVGSLDLNIKNLFRSGKELRFNWERFSQESQLLNVFYKHPFLVNSNISPSIRFNLLKQDNSFVNRELGLGVNTYIGNRTELTLGYDRANGNLITSDVTDLQGRGLADFKRNMYRVRISEGREDELGTLKEAVIWSTSVAAGRKTVNRNLGLPDSFYDSIEMVTNYFQFDMNLAYQLKIGKRQRIFQSVELGGIENSEVLANELYRMGGLNSLRGFNEKSIFAKYYGLSRLELRSFFENQSFMYVFYDQLWYRRASNDDAPFGIGLGFVLATSTGQFSFALAGGQSENQNLSFSEVRAHFGFISRF